MADYRFIKDLVIETYITEGGMPSYEKLTSLVKQHFPQSKWKESHYAWYKSQIKTGKISLPDGPPLDGIDDGDVDVDVEIEESFEARVSLERDLHDYLANRLSEIEPDLTLHENGVEFQTEAGRIDILAVDGEGRRVVVEIKAGKARDNALGQILGYMGCLAADSVGPGEVRGILVAADFDRRVVFAARALGNVQLLKYQLSFSFCGVS